MDDKRWRIEDGGEKMVGEKMEERRWKRDGEREMVEENMAGEMVGEKMAE